MAVWRPAVGEAGKTLAVDMPLRLDNAAALPTHPQRLGRKISVL